MTSGNENENEDERGFKIIDRRGEDRAEESPEETQPPAADPGSQSGGAEAPSPDRDADRGDPLTRIDFSTFVLSLGTSAMMHMGLVADPEAGPQDGQKNLPFARQTIDTLEMLQTKTRGNLESEEAQLIESLLYDLHMRFVEASR
jgi:hypothetical protein